MAKLGAVSRWLPPGWVRNSSVALSAIFVITVGGVVAVWFGSTLSVDQRIATISAVVTASALFVAVLAAILAILAYRSSAAQRQADIRPRVDGTWNGLAGIVTPYISFRNAGGTASRFIWVGQDDAAVFFSSDSLAAGSAPIRFVAFKVGDAMYRTGIATTLLIAEDIQGTWWDCRNGHRLTRAPEDYLTRRMEQVGLSNCTENLLASASPPRLPPDYV